MSESMHEKMMRIHDASQSGMSGKRQLLSYNIALKSKKEVAKETYTFIFEKPKGFTFKAGQHIRMTLIDPPETDNEGDSRFFSLVSSPQEKQLVIAMRMRNTAFKRVLGQMKLGTKVKIQIMAHSMHESFTLHDDATKPAVFVIGGIGIVPAFSIIKDALERKLPHKITLFYSNRRPEDAPFLSELQQLAKHHSNFKLIATMTESEKSTEIWRGLTGRIDAAMLKRCVSNKQPSIYYVAGLPDMVSAMKAALGESGVDEAAIRAEEFTGFDLNQLTKSSNQAWKRYIIPALVALLLIVVVLIHTGALGSLSHVGLFNGFSLSNPISYLVIGLVLAIIAVKVFAILKIRRVLHAKSGKLSVRDVLEAHKIAPKEK